MLFRFDELARVASDEHSTPETGKSSVLKGKISAWDALSLNNLHELCGRLPAPDEIYFLWSLKSFNAFNFIKYVVTLRGGIEELVVSTYNITKTIFESMMQVVDQGEVKTLHLTICDVSRTRFPQIYELVNSEAGKRPQVTIHYMWNHSKVCCMKAGDDHFVVEGSGNFSENSRHEQYVFLNNKEIYAFRTRWIRESIQ